MWIRPELFDALKTPLADIRYANWGLPYFIEVDLPEPNSFLKIKETLSRIGVASNRNRALYQTCHILHKREHYYITHFKELFILDGRQNNMTIEDVIRRNYIARLIDDWGLGKVLTLKSSIDAHCIKELVESYASGTSEEFTHEDIDDLIGFVQRGTKIVRYGDKDEWSLSPKYEIGTK